MISFQAGCEVHRNERFEESIILLVQLKVLIITSEQLITKPYLHCLWSISPPLAMLLCRCVEMILEPGITWLLIQLSSALLNALQFICLCQFHLDKQPVSVGSQRDSA
jgi:hypothetical protein